MHLSCSGASSSVDNRSFFAEGFVDWAARYYGRYWAACLPSGLATIHEEHERRLNAAIARRNRELAIPRERGGRAARHLARTLERHHGWKLDMAEARIASLAVELNVLDSSTASKDAFVTRVPIGVDKPLGSVLLAVLKGLRPPADHYDAFESQTS